MTIRTDCYLAILKKYKTQFPDAHFEIITRTANHVLSPSWQLLQQYKEEDMSFEQYTNLFCHEMEQAKCQQKMRELNKLAKTKDVFLVCYEKSDKQCHRRLVKKLMDDL